MENFNDRMKRLCAERGTTVAAMERACGLAKAFVVNTAKRGGTPSFENVKKIAKYLNVPNEVVMGEDPGAALRSSGVMIPRLGRVAAGVPISAVENIIGQDEITPKMAATGDFFSLRIKGDSMSPYIMDGDIVICRQQSAADTDDLVIALINGSDGVCKKIKTLSNGVMLISLNPAYEPMVFTQSEIDAIPVAIMGKVVEIRREI